MGPVGLLCEGDRLGHIRAATRQAAPGTHAELEKFDGRRHPGLSQNAFCRGPVGASVAESEAAAAAAYSSQVRGTTGEVNGPFRRGRFLIEWAFSQIRRDRLATPGRSGYFLWSRSTTRTTPLVIRELRMVGPSTRLSSTGGSLVARREDVAPIIGVESGGGGTSPPRTGRILASHPGPRAVVAQPRLEQPSMTCWPRQSQQETADTCSADGDRRNHSGTVSAYIGAGRRLNANGAYSGDTKTVDA